MRETTALMDKLVAADERVGGLLRAYFSVSPPGGVSRGAVLQEIVQRCSALDATREELVYRLVHDVGDEASAKALDRRSLERRELLHELFALIRNVAPRDMRAAQPERIDAIVEAIDARRAGDLAAEREALDGLPPLPAVRERVRQASERFDDALERAPSHPTGRRLAHERGVLAAHLHAAVDRLRDHPDAASVER